MSTAPPAPSASSSSSSAAIPPGGAATNASKRKIMPVAPKKKMTIKPFKVKPQLPEAFEEKTIERLERAVLAVFHSCTVADSQEELYRSVESLCLHKKAGVLFDKLRALMEKHIYETLIQLSFKTADQTQFLPLMLQAWVNHCNQMKLIRSIFLHLDRTFVFQNREIRSLWNLGLDIFAKYFEDKQTASVQQVTIKGLLNLIENERKGESVDRSMLKTLIKMFSALRIPDHFETPLLETSRKFYEVEGTTLLVNILSVPEYLVHVARRLQQEEDRVKSYMSENTLSPLILVVETELIKMHSSKIIDTGFDGMLESYKMDDLSRMYSLLSRVRCLSELKKAFGLYVKKTGQTIVLDKSNDATMIKTLIEFKSKLDQILKIAFQQNLEFSQVLRDMFESFINERANKPAELMAKFVDELLRSGNKTVSDDELESMLNQVMVLFKFINGKDVFEAFYKKDLAKRLLLNSSASRDAERSMIAKLRQECGHIFTQKLEGMFTDMEVSNELVKKYKLYLEHGNSSGIDSSIEYEAHVLTTSHWPTVKESPLNIPAEILGYQQSFEKFYTGLDKHNGRKLQWDHSMSHAVVEGKFPKGTRHLLVSAHQACVLLQFNHSKMLTFKDLKIGTGIEDVLLRRILESLLSQPKVLQKKPKEKDILETDNFRVNPDFESKLYRVKINAVQIQETDEEKQATTEKVFADRQYQLDACIVRIMKARRTLSHSLLVSEVLSQSKFPVEVSEIKKRIASLLEREYMERDQENSSMYHYIA
eukprot:TRINITY_DN5205_c0_g1_i1.p1 TRINITY_DN5205_c0_g1~~TRINITY_DN5205_c0_g1_i1.p1  ORF type:complete len:805 (-),score=215.21 TRINITY_DN5205_c0_g1_i1:777-3068(-)